MKLRSFSNSLYAPKSMISLPRPGVRTRKLKRQHQDDDNVMARLRSLLDSRDQLKGLEQLYRRLPAADVAKCRRELCHGDYYCNSLSTIRSVEATGITGALDAVRDRRE